MSGEKFGVSLTELAEIQRDWQQMSERMAEMTSKLGQIKSTVARAVAVDLMAAPFAGIIGFAAVAGQIAGEVEDINNRAEKLQQTKEKLTQAIGDDVRKLQSVIKEYQEADRKIEEDQRNQDKDRQQPEKPKPSGNGDGKGSGNGGHGSGSGGHGSGDQGGNDSGDQGDKSDPDAKPSHEGKIPVKDVEYGGRGSWKSGEAAVRDYISQTLDLMGITDPAAREQWTKGLLTMAGRESSFNSLPLANGWDSNATGPKQSDGFPANSSRGPWQCIPSTFAAYHQTGTSTNIYDPVASCAASMNYMMDRYNVSRDGHDLAAKVQQANPNKGARGY
ncbi:hypothetical protein [Kitasatospora sp. NPDC002040]|uniref:hypothetical protein n=1 Tax=Kitasatospora sp. NPDC002040 TaxID=3154661 RepID=UPI0033289DA4